ncbi:DUF2076 domain-containing protein [Acidomonas methanolica]|uniref:ABC transporter substrate-binding protein n=2 Tax=Acidomonas methanolica TaxID=437 RepID=A0A023D289_ACIMT|nr:DUF2076 domain-containing protein [Acidomonas methanolica]MBU2652822.1 DUF2076 domain-containing protein [Acidomonas methanolica]TCS31226.1 hypothetical protein EDC31_10368 [Acidomonas methanolica]GAJ27936.1 hypothetical protein Amme_011_036 [Acidomonas methanolica NBRC 104435]GEK98527.1 hypothetical protein AME01nite_10260 [Acidomonas methanolica NBRC 104435]
MNSEERDLISRFIARVGGAATPGPFGGSSQPPVNLPPIDPEADRFIAENFQKYPEARYRVTQMAVVQEAALVEAQNRIRQLQFQLQQAQQQIAQGQQQQRGGGGLFGGLFGGNRQQAAPPPGWGQQPPQQQGYYGAQQPPPNYPPGYNPAMFQSRGSGFLGSALTTATGVAGGMLAANAIESLFSHHDGGMGGAGAGGFGGDTIINNYGDAGADPFGGSGVDAPGNFDAGSFGDSGGGDFGGDFGGFDDTSF